MQKSLKEKLEMSNGKINRLIPFSSVDGPGNRFAIFLQGCMFNCLYCHNPETINDCIHCGICVPFCHSDALAIENGKVIYHSENCTQCDECIKNCPHLSSPKVLDLSAEEVMDEIRKVRPFIRGITVSGGECTLQKEFLITLFQLAKDEGLSTFIDTNGGVPLWNAYALMDLTDGVMLDVKAFDGEQHRALTGVRNENVLKNLTYCAESGKLFEVRTVVLQGDFGSESTVENVAEIIAKIDQHVRYKLIKYRHFGVRDEYLPMLARPADEQMLRLKEIVRMKGLTDVVIV